MAETDPLFKRIFKQQGLSRKDLYQILEADQYKQDFIRVLQENFIEELSKDRNKRILKTIDALIDLLYYSQDSSNHAALSKVIKRLPWSVIEMNQSIDVVKSLLVRN